MFTKAGFGKLSAFLLAISPTGSTESTFVDPHALSNESLSVSRPAIHVQKDLGKGIHLRADIIYENSLSEVVILGGAPLTGATLKRLVNTEFQTVYPGTFHNNNISMGDIVGVSVKNPEVPLSKPFGWGLKNRVGKSVHERFCYAQREGEPAELVRRSNLKDASGKLIPSGAPLNIHFQNFLGGLARINFSDPAMKRAILGTTAKDTRSFIHLFNADNRNFNRKASYEGLDGYRTRPRSGIALCEDPKTGGQVTIVMCIGDGRSELKGATIKGLAAHMTYLAKEHGLLLNTIGVPDGGGSVGYAHQAGVLVLAAEPASTAIAVRNRAKFVKR